VADVHLADDLVAQAVDQARSSSHGSPPGLRSGFM
jgi:hypothetical protein